MDTLPPHGPSAIRHRRASKAMSDSAVRAYAAGKRFAAGTLDRWLAQKDEDRDAFLAVAERLRLGENQVRDLLEQVEDIAVRQGTCPAAVLRDAAVTSVLDRGLGRNETIHALRRALRRLRYPELSRAEAELSRLIKELELPSGVKLELPEGLESERLSVRVTASSAHELRALAASLGRAVGLEQIDRMYSILEGKW